MVNLNIKLLLVFIFCFSLNIFSQGLLFQSNDITISQRTAYNVFEKSTPVFRNTLAISFDLSILDFNAFGYICSITEKGTGDSFSLILSEKDNSTYLSFNLDGKQNLLKIPLNKAELGYRRWHRISIDLLSLTDSIEIKMDNKAWRAYFKRSKRDITPVISFGKHENIIDVPKMAIRKLLIQGSQRNYEFDFNEHEGSEVHELNGEVFGKVEYPVWLINDSFHWKLRYKYRSSAVAAVNFDAKSQRMIILNKDSILFYYFISNTSKINRYKNSLNVPIALGMSFMDTLRNLIYVYEINNLPVNTTTIASLDLTNLSWTTKSSTQLEVQIHHHNSYFNIDNQTYTIFGGFGNQRFSGSFRTYDITTDKWSIQSYSGDRISPRFFSGLAKVDKTTSLIYGGIGNETGDQSLGRSYNDDCFQINHSTHSIKKLWNGTAKKEGMVSVRNMVISDDKRSFYTLCYPEYIPDTYLKLYQFSIENGNYEVLADSIPLFSEKIETNANLYLNPITNELYCTTQEFFSDGSQVIKIYSLSEPPVSKKIFTGSQFNLGKSRVNYFSILIAILGCLALFLFYRRRITVKKIQINNQRIKIEQNDNPEHIAKEKRVNAIYLFGDFCAFDHSGKDITQLFSTRIKQLFVFILLNKKNGVTSSQIYSAIWPHKSIEQAKNSKGVTLNQLRNILTKMEGISLITEKGSLYFEIDNRFYCDYLCYQDLLKDFSHNSENNDALPQIINIISKGPFIKAINFEYFDPFKTNFEDEILIAFLPLIDKHFLACSYSVVIQLSYILNMIDAQNEQILRYELVSYMKLNKSELAEKRFNTFRIIYKRENKSDFPYTFKEVSNPKLIIIK